MTLHLDLSERSPPVSFSPVCVYRQPHRWDNIWHVRNATWHVSARKVKFLQSYSWDYGEGSRTLHFSFRHCGEYQSCYNNQVNGDLHHLYK